MAMGRPPVPTYLKMIRGNPGGRPLNTREPKPTGDLKEPPDHFNEEQREVWNYAIEHAPRGLLKKIDSAVLAIWCVAFCYHRYATDQVIKFGMLIKSPKQEVPIQSPWLPIVNKQAFIMLRACDHLGFSPASRTRIMTGEAAGTGTDWDEIVSNAG